MSCTRCKDCRHWSNNICHRVEQWGDSGSGGGVPVAGMDAKVGVYAHDDSGLFATLYTGPDFGCVRGVLP